MKHIAIEKLQNIYIRWSYNEIFKYIIEHPNIRPLDAIDDFIYMVDHASVEAKTGEQSFIFSVAHDTAQYISDSLSLKVLGELSEYNENEIRIAEAVELFDEIRKERGDIYG